MKTTFTIDRNDINAYYHIEKHYVRCDGKYRILAITSKTYKPYKTYICRRVEELVSMEIEDE